MEDFLIFFAVREGTPGPLPNYGFYSAQKILETRRALNHQVSLDTLRRRHLCTGPPLSGFFSFFFPRLYKLKTLFLSVNLGFFMAP